MHKLFYALPYRYGQRGINGISRLPGSAFCVSAVHRCLRETVVLPVGNIWMEVKVGEDPILFAAAGDNQAKPTRVSGGLDLLVITGETIVWPSDYVLRLFFFIQEPFEVFS